MVALTWEGLAERARMGEWAAENALLVRLKPYLLRVAAAVRPAEEEDLCQVGLVAVWKGLRRYDPARPFLPWARTVGKRAMLTAAGRVRAAVEFEDGFGLSLADRPVEESATDRLPDLWVAHLMGGLDDRDQMAVAQRFGLLGLRESSVADVATGQERCRQQVSTGLSDSLAVMKVAFEVRYGGLCV